MNKLRRLLFLAIILVAIFVRVYNLNQNPPSLYWDEASLGYNAYSILTSGHDEHGERLPLARFIAFGDYKPPGYIYSIVPFMAVLGVNELAIRLPSAVAGVIMVILTYYLGLALTRKKEASLASAALLAISPWSLQLSRAAFEANLAALLNVTGVLMFLLAIKRKWLYPVAAVFFVLSFYTFNANRILAPLIILLLVACYFRDIWSAKKWILGSFFLTIVLLLPSASYLHSRESRLRFQEVSIFTSVDTVVKANRRIDHSGSTWWSKILNNRRVYFARDFLSHYVDNFRGEFLFISGDRNPRFSTRDVGELYLFELPFLIVGLLRVMRQKDKTTALLFGWLLLAPIPAAMARETPHMLRIVSILPTYQLFTGIGILAFWECLKQKTRPFRVVGIGTFLIVVGASLVYYFHNYWVHYPREWSGEWQYGYKQMVERVNQQEGNYDRVSVTSSLGRPYIYFLLYNQVSPDAYLSTRKANRDWFGLWNVYGFGKYDFTEKPPAPGERVLKVSTAGSIDPTKLLTEVKALDSKTIFEIGEP